jgi:hypothetical protein
MVGNIKPNPAMAIYTFAWVRGSFDLILHASYKTRKHVGGAQMIQRILVDHGPNRGYAKRGGGAVRVPLEELRLGTQFLDVDVVALDQALAALGRIDPGKSALCSCDISPA